MKKKKVMKKAGVILLTILIVISTLITIGVSGKNINTKLFEDRNKELFKTDYTKSYTLSDYHMVNIKVYEQVWNNKTTTIDLTTYFAIPPKMANQQIIDDVIIYNPQGFQDNNGGWTLGDQSFVAYKTRTKNPGKIVSTMYFWAELYTITYDIDPSVVTNNIPEFIKQRFLGSPDRYCMDDPVVQAHAQAAKGGKKVINNYYKAWNIYNYVGDHLEYQDPGNGWDDVRTILDRGSGTCSEYSWTYIALCRLNGIPARWVGGIYTGDHSNGFVDKSGHRWVEIYLDPYGWIPVDPTFGDGNRLGHFGIRTNRCFATTIGSGEVYGLGWRYTSSSEWTGGSADVERTKYSVWLYDSAKPKSNINSLLSINNVLTKLFKNYIEFNIQEKSNIWPSLEEA